MSQSKGTIFTQVTRTAAGDTSNPLDPLSVFALSQPAPTTAATEANNTKQESLQSDYLIVNKSSDLLEFKKEDLSVPRTFADALHNNSKNPSTATTRNNSSVDAPSPRFFRENKLMDSTSSVDYPGGSVSGDEVDRALQSVGDESEQDGAFRYMTGERKIISMVDVYLQLSPRDHLPGILFMTNYRVVFLVGNDVLRTLAAVNPSIESYLQVPLCSIDRIERERKHKDQNASTGVTILIICKEAKQHRITLRTTTSYKSTVQSRESEIERALSVLSAYAFPNNLQYAFAYSHKLQCKILDSFEPILEYSRQTVLDSNFWRVTTSNEEYRLCRSYPRVLIVPKTLTDDELAIIASFRSGQRLPVLCWGSKNSRATMWRSSQPKAGVSGSCLQDEKMLDIIAHSCAFNRTLAKSKSYTGEPVLHIVDLRSRTSAMANRATGAGYESHSNYPNCKLEFYGIPNIHVVRDSYRNICSTVLNPNANTATDLTFSKQVEDSQWLANLRLILKASWETAKFIARNQPVLVHCSHGWDRTSQVCGLAQLFLDPFYRTMAGFRILLEKEWCTFGHQFQMRCAHTQDRSVRKEDEMSPIFLQFLDCVWQVQHQSPHYFEFNSRYILTIADHIYSGRFGNFLHSCELDRTLHNAHKRCADIWSYLAELKPYFINPLYADPQLPASQVNAIFLPPLTQLLRNVTLWSDYFLRWSSVFSTVTAPYPLSNLLYRHGRAEPLQYYGRDYTTQKDFLSISKISHLGEQVSTSETDNDANNEKSQETKAISLAAIIEQDGNSPNSNTSNDVNENGDWDVLPMVTSDDFWESAYRMERLKRKKLELKLHQLSSNSDYASKSDLFSQGDDEILAEDVIKHQQENIEILMRLLKEKSPEDYSDFLKANTMQNDTLSNYYQRRGSTFTINANSKMDGSSRFGNHCAGTDSPLYRLNGSHVDDNSGLYYDESSNHNCQQNSDGGVSGQKTDGEDSPVFFI